MDEIQKALQIEGAAKIISGAPFPSKKSLSRAREVVEFLSNRAAPAIPEGFVLVPVEPTQEMVDQGTHCTHAEDWEVRSAWIYMLIHRPDVK